MARLFSSGFELNSLTTGMEFDEIGSGLISIATDIVRSGTYSLKYSGTGSSGYVKKRLFSSGAGRKLIQRVYFYFSGNPQDNRKILIFDLHGTGTVAYIQSNTDKTLGLYKGDGTHIGSNSSVITANSWVRVELLYDSSTGAGTHTLEAKLDGTVFATSSSLTLQNVDSVIVGDPGSPGGSSTTHYFDDWAVNDTTGGSQTSYPGLGHIIHLKPNAVGDANSFAVQVGGTAGPSNNYTRVNEIPPDDATSYNGSSVLNQEDLFNIDDTGSAINSGDTINLVSVGIRMADLVAADASSSFKVEIEKTTGGTKSQSSTIIPNSTSWLTNAALIPRLSPLTLYTDPDSNAWTKANLDTTQIGYTLSNFNVQTIAVSNVWLLVDYTPASETTTSTSSSTSTTTTTSTSTTSTSTSTTTSTSTSSSTSTTTTSTSTTTTHSTSTSSSTSTTTTSTSTTSSTSTTVTLTTTSSSTSTTTTVTVTTTSTTTSTTSSTSTTTTYPYEVKIGETVKEPLEISVRLV
jgi:hypothetical protein